MLNPDICIKCMKKVIKCENGKTHNETLINNLVNKTLSINCHIGNRCPNNCNPNHCIPADKTRELSILSPIPNDCPYSLEHTMTMKQDFNAQKFIDMIRL